MLATLRSHKCQLQVSVEVPIRHLQSGPHSSSYVQAISVRVLGLLYDH